MSSGTTNRFGVFGVLLEDGSASPSSSDEENYGENTENDANAYVNRSKKVQKLGDGDRNNTVDCDDDDVIDDDDDDGGGGGGNGDDDDDLGGRGGMSADVSAAAADVTTALWPRYSRQAGGLVHVRLDSFEAIQPSSIRERGGGGGGGESGGVDNTLGFTPGGKLDISNTCV